MHLLTRAFVLVIFCCTFTEKVVSQQPTFNGMFYIMADNAASCSSIQAVQQLASVASSTANYRFYVFWEKSPLATQCGTQTVLGQAPWTGARIFQVTPNSLTVMADLGVVDSASPDVLANFLTMAKNAFTADYYLLTFFGPGGYFTHGSQNSKPNTSGWLFLDLASSLTSAVRSLALPKGKLDLVIMDSSYSASHENMQLFSPATRFYAGFQAVQPNPAYTVFGSLSTVPDFERPALRAFGEGVFQAVKAQNQNLPVGSFSIIDTSLIANVTEAFDTFSRAFRLFPQHTFAQVRRSALEVDSAPYPVTAVSAVDLGYLSYWLTYYRRWPFLQKNWGPDLTNAINNAVVYSWAGEALPGASGISIYFPLSNTSQSFLETTSVYRFYEFNFAWYSFLLAYLYTPHVEYFFTSPRIVATNGGGFQAQVNTTLDSVVKANTLFGVLALGNFVLLSGSNQVEVANYSEANNLLGAWDGTLFRLVGTTNFYPFVQQIKSMYIVSVAANCIDCPDTLLLKGLFPVGSNSVVNFYVQDGPNVALYALQPGTRLFLATTKPYLIDTNRFGTEEVQTDYESFTTTGTSFALEKIPFTQSGFQNAYFFLTTRNIDDYFGYVGWRIPSDAPTTAYLLQEQNRLLTNVTVNFIQKVFSTKTKFLIAIRNNGFRDSSINVIEIPGLPSGLDSAQVRPAGFCRSVDSTLTNVRCLVDFIPAKSFFKISMVFPRQIPTPLTLNASGANFIPRQVIAKVILKTRTPTRRPTGRPSGRPSGIPSGRPTRSPSQRI